MSSSKRGSRDKRAHFTFLGGSVLMATLLLVGCQDAEPTAEVSSREMERAKSALQPLKEQLVDALTGALQEGDPRGWAQRARFPNVRIRSPQEDRRDNGRQSHDQTCHSKHLSK